MTLAPHLHLPRSPDTRRPSPSPVDYVEERGLIVRLLALAEHPERDVASVPFPSGRGLEEAKLRRASLLRPPSRLSAAIRDDDHEIASLRTLDIEPQRCSVLVDPHCGNPTGLVAALLSANDPLKLPRWFARRSRQIPVLLAPAASRITRRCSSVKHKLRSVPYICKTKHDCVVCQTIIREREIHLRCGHYCHVECLLHLVESSTHDQTLFPPRCCDQPIPERRFRRYMSPALATTYREKAAEFSTIRRVYCSNPACSRFLGPRMDPEISINYFCAVCATRTCSSCRLGVSPGPTGPPHVCKLDRSHREVLDLARKKGWTRCPACDQMIELHSGCYHMTCVCAMQFCYACGSPWKTCACPQWEQVELRELGEVDAQPIRPPPIDAARPPTPPPKPTRPESGLHEQPGDPLSVFPLQLQSQTAPRSRDHPQGGFISRTRSVHPEGLAPKAQGLRSSAYGTRSGVPRGERPEDAEDPLSLGLHGVDCRVLEGGLLAQRRRGILLSRPLCV
ncbi:hypothetical protein DAEQUDRAFT_770240 [Daedalea quercina L-15889]|uniref:RBR-type E3 ubiquitin transferase n=1 Tax=Daedalea quercina L-15889 TaxID=1314783 RepID=A0A165L0I7_9APHY|nr:hypothetical protein DAEQUDRAFT_770240 [Daedalea quercina L-15889]